MSDLIQRLWESDEASALTNEAAREIEAMQAAIAQMQGHTFFVQDADGFLRRWAPPKPRAALSTDGGEG